MLSEARSLPCFQLIFDVATFESSIGSVKLDLEYFKYSRSSLTEPIDDSKVATSKTSWKHGRLRASDSIIAQLAEACAQENPHLRPSMRSIVVALMMLSSTTED
uniref:Serine-threonine/tyrosine-protein kinase catalytic domain-containing protein n=1 Tax=Ananas comosus var. bracteatus TaxID=296719 RepID=A0A6V7QYE0_ANACO